MTSAPCRRTRLRPTELAIAAGLLVMHGALSADIATDGRLGPSVQLSGADMIIGAELGQTRGGNLFHSFERFGIPAGHRATFTGPDHIKHVISRVTGGTLSHIDGQLRSDVGQADLYLINPAGLVMGPNATVDVPASLHLSTADELRLRDGSRFSAVAPEASTLSMAAPEAFGFLGRRPAGDLELHGSQLSVRTQETLNLNAGNIRIESSADFPSLLDAEAGTIRLEAVGQIAASVPVETAVQRLDAEVPHRGDITLIDTTFDTSGEGGGLIMMRAGTAHLLETDIYAENYDSPIDAAGGIDLRTSASLLLDFSALYASTSSAGAAGTIRIKADNLRLDNVATIDTDSFVSDPVAAGAAGQIEMRVSEQLSLRNGSSITSAAWGGAKGGTARIEVGGLVEILSGSQIATDSIFAPGAAGSVEISAGALRIGPDASHSWVPDSTQGITSEAYGSGAAGTISLNVAGTLEVLAGGRISSSTESAGDAGQIAIQAAELSISGGFVGSLAGPEATGRVGRIELAAQRIRLSHDAAISVASHNPASAATDGKPATAGSPAEIRLVAEHLSLSGSRIDASSEGFAAASAISLQGDRIKLERDSRISTQSRRADAGPIAITGGSLWLDNSRITTSAQGPLGNGGDIELRPRQMVLEGGFIQANTAATEAKGGDIAIGADALIASQDQLSIGALERQTFVADAGRNVIQAAAPLGVQGAISLATPELDITANLVSLRTPFQDPDAILSNLCQIADAERASALIEEAGRGPSPSTRSTLPSPLGGQRLERLIDYR